MEKNRSQQTLSAHVYRQHMQMIDLLCYQIEEIESVLEQMIEAREDWSRKAEIIKSVPGLSHMSAIGLISDLPELGTCSSKQIAALVEVNERPRKTLEYQNRLRGSANVLRRPLDSAGQ